MNETQQLIDEQLVYRLERFDTISGWWAWALLFVLCILTLYWLFRWYRRDVHELPRPLRATLLLLRFSGLALLILFFLQPERRARQRIERPSEAIVLIDTSQSMSLPATDLEVTSSRMEVIKQFMSETPFLAQLTAQHLVTVYATGTRDEPIELWTAGRPSAPANAELQSKKANRVSSNLMGWNYFGALCALGALGFLASSGWLSWRESAARSAPSTLIGVGLAMIACLIIGTVGTLGAQHSWKALWGFGGATVDDSETETTTPTKSESENPFSAELAADGPHSHLGDALQWLQRHHDPATLAGIWLVSDGQNNGGLSLDAAGRQLKRQSVPVFAVGLGTSRPPANIRVVDLEVPPRVYPGDRFAISSTLQATGIPPGEIEVQLLDGLDVEPWQPLVVETRRVEMPADGTPLELKFELEPDDVGRRQIGIRVASVTGEQNLQDNQLQVRYEVIKRRLKALVIAGGPMREYQFVRNLLHRDSEIMLDVWLQSGQKGMSQDSNQILSEFPSTPESLFEYDVILAFDPDWDQMNAAQIELLDRWVAEQAGGFALIAGPVFTPRLAASRNDQKSLVRNLLPVVLAGRSVSFEEGRYEGEEPWPLQWTEEGRRADFLRPLDNAEDAREVWGGFSGFYGYFSVREPKPGATVYATYSDPTTAVDGQLPVLIASQFYGAGRTFFLGSGELWRLRTEGDAYFDRIYTKLVRWAAEGRLLRDSNRGVLLVDPPRAVVGENITIRAVLLNDQFKPLEAPEVEAQIFEPGHGVKTLTLRRLEGQPRGGTYGGQFVARYGGQYEVRIELGDLNNRQVLKDSVQVRLPTLELERPRRNDAELGALATLTSGQYLPLEPVSGSERIGFKPLLAMTDAMVPRPQETILPGTPDRDFQRRRNASLMWCFAGMLIFEWVIRRLNRLA